LEIDRKVSVGMRRNVFDREVAYSKQISKTDDCSRNARRGAKCGIAAAGNQFVMFITNAQNGGQYGIRRNDPCKGQGELPNLCCHVSYSFLRFEPLRRFLSRIWRRTWPASCRQQKRHHVPSCRLPWLWRDRSKCLEGDPCPRI